MAFNFNRCVTRDEPKRDLICNHIDLSTPLKGALPHSCHPPPRGEKLGSHSLVASNVCVEFRLPEFRPSRRRRCVATALMAMPETAVDEHDRVVLRENEIGPANNILGMKAISEASHVQSCTKLTLGLCVTTFDARHHSGSGRFVHYVDH